MVHGEDSKRARGVATLPHGVKQVLAVTLAVILAGAVLIGGIRWLGRPGAEAAPGSAAAAPVPSDAVEPVAPSATPPSPPKPSTAASPSCAKVTHAFRPRRITVPGVTQAARVLAPPREADGVPGAPPLTRSGKSAFAWDRQQGTRPGDAVGNVLLNAHTWPDGSALGNRLLARLKRGDRIIVLGATERLCYRVTERVEVPAEPGMPRYYTRDGPPQLAIVVCSGRRLGPGVWTKRTVWFAAPSA